jgi:large subunit ribosomal protein L24e
MALVKCAFCGVEQEDFKGTYFVKNDGAVLYFSSSKCMKNHLKLKRDKRKIRWTEAFHVTRNKRMAKEKERMEKEDKKDKEKLEMLKEKAVEKAEKVIAEKAKKAEKKGSE